MTPFSPDLARLVEQAGRAAGAADLRFPSPGPAPGRSSAVWEADVAKCRASWDTFVLAGADASTEVDDSMTVQEVTIGSFTARLYRPAGDDPVPAVVVYHGGGFWMAGGEAMRRSGDPLCRLITRQAGAVVLTVDYRLAPEHKYPAAVDDCSAALQWLHEHAARLGVDPARIGLFGVSSGGNMAAVAALLARDQGRSPRVLVLLAPALELTGPGALADMELHDRLDPESVTTLLALYLPPGTDPCHPTVSPGLAPDLAGMPPTFVVAGEFDVLRDQGTRFAARLQTAGVPAQASVYPMTHGVALPETVAAFTADIVTVLTRALPAGDADPSSWFPPAPST